MARTKENYEALARAAVVELLDIEHAVVWTEVEAKLADQQWAGLPAGVRRIDPHHLTAARGQLIKGNVIRRDVSSTRGGRSVTVFTPVRTNRRTRAIADAAARKRLLEARYLGWASGSAATGVGIIGPAGEAVVHASLSAAAPHGYRLLTPDRGETRTMYGEPVPVGPLDNAAFYTAVDGAGVPTATFDVLVEVKNIRGWIYPSAAELHQLLLKAARLQIRHPERDFLPVLVCRQAHYLTTEMAKQALGTSGGVRVSGLTGRRR